MLRLGDDPEYLSVMGALLIFISVGQGPTVLAVGKGEGCFEHNHIFFLSLSRWEIARLSLKTV